MGSKRAATASYIRVDGTKIWSLTQLERQLRPEAYGRRRAATSTADRPGRRFMPNPGYPWRLEVRSRCRCRIE
jgi:hypothetical protein